MLVARVWLALVILVTIAACDSSTEARPAPFPTASESSSTPQIKSPPPLPKPIVLDERSGRAFLRHWIEVLNYAMATGDTGPLLELSGPTCGSCRAAARRIRRTYSSGGRISGGGWAIKTLTMHDLSHYESLIAVRAHDVVRSHRAPSVEHFNAVKLRLAFELRIIRGAWVMGDVVRLST